MGDYNPKKILPNLFTTANLLCGFFSIVYSTKQEFIIASWFIVASTLADALDGVVARLTNTSSKFGVELDSLADLVSFGVAPALLVYQIQLFFLETWGVLISSLLLIGGALRLARFNTQLVGFDKEYFAGLPIPSSAITVASFIILYSQNGIIPSPYHQLTIPLVIILSLLMVSRIKYDTLPKFNAEGIKRKPYHFVFVLIAATIIVLSTGKALFYIFVFIILFGIFRQIFNLLTGKIK